MESEVRDLVKKVEGSPVIVDLDESLDKDDCKKIATNFGDSVEVRVEHLKVILYSLDLAQLQEAQDFVRQLQIDKVKT